MCPAIECKEQVGSDVIFSKATLRSCLSDDLDGSPVNTPFADKALVMHTDYSSSKIKAVLEILQSQCKSNSPDSDSSDSIRCNGSTSSGKEVADSSDTDITVVKHITRVSNLPNEGPIKTIVFSQWTSMLDLVEMSLNQAGIPYRRLDGTMTLGARDKAVKDFNTDPEVWPLP